MLSYYTTTFFIGYIAASVFSISILSLYFSIAGTISSALSFALNIWPLNDHFQKQDLNKQSGIKNIQEQKKLTKIRFDIIANIFFLIGEITHILPLKSSIIPFISTTFFILECVIMATI
ncbi:hypothetical protein [Wolbachia endosymbiont of Wuchereria bancrofti]|uniref:hypothetical protein n=1 Tax=Wolbachia endosymbiont of Wuchereria bancrofti TaxID=96496 RepID=UPI000B693FB6|nr:hypothetical protein CCY16_00391 [Wolbachia endosymbiont of Wuchereria bancrofti]